MKTLWARGRAVLGPVALATLLGVVAAPQLEAQFIPYFGKNKVKYDDFSWRVYKSPHFEMYYYPEFEQHLARVSSYAESAYQKISSDFKHELTFPVPMILYKTHSEFEETNLFPDFVPEGVLAFAEPMRDRMVLPIDEPPDKLQGLITHELTHVFAYDIIPRNLIQRGVPDWVDEGLADYERAAWDTLDLMTLRDAAVTDQIPKLSRFENAVITNARLPYNMGHAAFEFIEARYGKEGVRQFLYTLRKSILGGGVEGIYQQAFRLKPDEFDEAFDKWLKERFKPYRDKQRPSDYGRDLSPDAERGPYTQVLAFAPSPSGEVLAAVTVNRSDQELDLVLMSAKDREVIKNLTPGYTDRYEDLSLNFNARSLGRSLSFDPKGDSVAFFARKGKKRSLFLISVINGAVLRQIPMDLDQTDSPCLTPDGRHVLFSGLKEGVSDIYILDLETGKYKNLTDDAFADSDPEISPDGNMVVYTRRVSGYGKLYMFPLANPTRKTQLTFGTFEDATPTFSSDGNTVFYVSNADDDIYNLRSIDLRTGVVKQYTDTLGGILSPGPLRGKTNDRVAFITYFKGDFLLHTIETLEPMKEVDQEVRVADEEPLDFQPDVVHQVVAENKRRKRTFEKLFLEGRPPLNVGVTSGGDFYGGSQVALADVLGDQNITITAASVREFRTYEATYYNLSKRFHYGFSAFDQTQFFFAAPYGLGINTGSFFREGAIATQRFTGANLVAQYPFDKYRRLEFSAGFYKVTERFENADAEQAARDQAAALGVPFFLNNGRILPISVNFVQETTRFREFGPLTGSTVLIGAEYAPSFAGALSRTTLQADLRKYLRVGGTSMVLATRVKGFTSFGDNPGIFYFGGNMELRGFPYLSLGGNEGFFANVELRLPLIDLAKTPIGLLGPVRGTLYLGTGGAHFKGEPFQFATSKAGISYLGDPVFGEPVSGFHLVDGRASYGAGLQIFLLGYPLHFDWSRITDFKTTMPGTRFDFWVGFDF
jgi:Tol biopolymer transport system component